MPKVLEKCTYHNRTLHRLKNLEILSPKPYAHINFSSQSSGSPAEKEAERGQE